MTQDEKTEKLAEFVRYYAICACCEEDDVCVDGCTHRDDDPVGHDVMIHAREVLEEAK